MKRAAAMTEPTFAATVAITALIFAPMTAAMAGWLIPGLRFINVLGVTVAALLLIALFVVTGEALAADGLLLAFGGHHAPLGIELVADGFALVMLWLTQTVAFAVNVYMIGWSRGVDARTAVLVRVIWLLLWSALNGLFLSADLFNIYVTMEITTLCGVALVAASGGPVALTAALRYLQFALVGSILYLLGVALIYGLTGTLSLRLLDGADFGDPGGLTALVVITLGLFMKAALFPLHGWLAPGHSAAPSPASAVLSALVVKAAAYLLLRIWTGPFGATWTPLLAQMIGVLGVAGIIYASLQALRQTRLKLVIAYSTIAQLGYLLLLVPLANVLAWNGVLYHALAHGLAKAAMFMAAGNVIRAIGNDRLDNLAGMDRTLSGNLLVIAIAGISLAGLPPSGGFIGKWWLISGALAAGQWWWAVGVALGGLLAAAYVFRILRFGMLSPDTYAEAPLHRAHGLPASMLWPPYLLAFAALLLGFGGELLAPLLELSLPAALGS